MEYSRSSFIKKILISAGSLPVLVEACTKNSSASSTGSLSGSDSSSVSASTSTDCVTTPTEVVGPYPYDLSKNSAIFRTDITEDKTGIPLAVTFTLVNANDNCSVLEGARIDIWHCDKDGYYSEYNEPGYLGTEDNSGKTFLRGIQLSDSAGQVTFNTIYPGWYSGRVTHIHIEVFVDSVLKLASQVAFPDAVTTEVYNTSLYSPHGQNSITNSSDQIFSDGYATELLTLTGDTTSGYTAAFKVGVPV